MGTETALQEFIGTHTAVIEKLNREAALAEWELQTTSSPEAMERSEQLNKQIARIYADAGDYAFLQSLDIADIQDPMLARQLELLRLEFEGGQMSEEAIEEIVSLEVAIADQFNAYRPSDPRSSEKDAFLSDNAIDDVLASSTDCGHRKEVWLASREIGCETAGRVVELVKLRNREAQRLGYSNYYVMALALQEQNCDQLFELLGQLETECADAWNNCLTKLQSQLRQRYGLADTDPILPWHHANRFFQEPGPGAANLDRFFEGKALEPIASGFFHAIGLPIDALLPRADLYEREGKCQHAFCLDADRLGDVRVLCNLSSDERWMSTLLHEYGHAVYDLYNNPALPYLLRCPAHTLTTESIALLMGRYTKNADWLHVWAGADKTEAESIASAANQELKDYFLIFMRWCFVMCHFERGLYADPDQDLDALWWSLTERFQGLSCPEEDRKPGMWAAKIHIATAPVYYHNYLLGEMAASQLLNHLENTVLHGDAMAIVNSARVGQWMRTELFEPGATRPWQQWLQHATGEELNPRYFVGQLSNL
jgi:peptidyl-dipeptidase A